MAHPNFTVSNGSILGLIVSVPTIVSSGAQYTTPSGPQEIKNAKVINNVSLLRHFFCNCAGTPLDSLCCWIKKNNHFHTDRGNLTK